MMFTQKDFYISIEAFYSEEEIQKMFNLVENIEETNMAQKDVYNLLKNYKPKDVNVILGIAFFENKQASQYKIFLAERRIIKDNLIGYRNSIRNNTMNEFVKDYKSEDFFYLQRLILEDELYLADSQKDLYIDELRYLNGEIESVMPEVNITKKGLLLLKKDRII